MTLKAPAPIPSEYKWNTIPEILYEAPKYPGAKTDPIPYIEVPTDKKMPPVLFIMEYRHTGENEIGSGGTPEEIMDQLPHKFVDFEFLMDRLKDQFDEATMTQIYYALGMYSRSEARKLGEQTLERVIGKTEVLKEETKAVQDERVEKIRKIMEAAQEALEKKMREEEPSKKDDK